jgi:hypothetical protein
MIDAYLDESGIHDGAAICVVAGYFGGPGQWKKFAADWRKTLNEAEVPLEKFHAKDLIRRNGFFSDWSDEKHGSFISAVGHAICRYKLFPVSQAVVVADFNSLTQGQRKAFTGATVKDDGTILTSGCPSKPYFLPFQYALRNICSTRLWAVKPTSSSVWIGHLLNTPLTCSST